MATESQGGTVPLSVSHPVITKPNVTENQLDGCLLYSGIIQELYCMYLYTVHVLSCYRGYVHNCYVQIGKRQIDTAKNTAVVMNWRHLQWHFLASAAAANIKNIYL